MCFPTNLQHQSRLLRSSFDTDIETFDMLYNFDLARHSNAASLSFSDHIPKHSPRDSVCDFYMHTIMLMSLQR